MAPGRRAGRRGDAEVGAMKFRLCAEDREKYPADQEWFEFSVDLLADQPASFVDEFERTIGMSVPVFGTQLEETTTRGLKAAFWVARRIAGVQEDYAAFDPKVWKAEQESEDPRDPLESKPTRRSTGRARASKR
jgi:hypothetical protein